MTTYEEALQKWAEKRYGAEAKVLSVDLEMIERGFCDTCGYETPAIRVEYLFGGDRNVEEFEDWTFSEFLQQLVEAAQS